MDTPQEQSTADVSEARLLIVEDDAEVGAGLKEFFTLKEYDVTHVADGEKALREMTTLPPYDLVLLDVMLPKKSGFEILREARRAGVDSPVIMLTVKGSKEDKLRGFELGADDYVTKPFNAEELAARVRAVLKRSQPPSDAPMDVYEFGDVTVNFSSHMAQRNGESVEFTALEFDILRYLIQYRGQTVTRKQLLRDVWGIDEEIITRTIDRHMASVRKKIEPDPSSPEHIKTVYGIGYRFEG